MKSLRKLIFFKRVLISNIEIILNSNKIRVYLTSISNRISEKIQLNLKNKQQNVECNTSKHVLNLHNLNSFDCSLGCQLHVVSAGILCATEMNKKYLIINHDGKYDRYFKAFEPVCENDKRNIGI